MIAACLRWVARLTRRPTKVEWAFIVAIAVSSRGECTRRRVGAVVIDRNGRLAGAGYNGSWAGGPSCLEGQCPRAQTDVLPGSSYDTGPGACHAVHAELNAVLDVSDKGRLEAADLYVTCKPCDGCMKIVNNTRVARIHWLDETGKVRTAWRKT